MIKFGAETQDGKKLVGLGLTADSLRYLQEGRPIRISADSMKDVVGIEVEVLIFYGETNEVLQKDLQRFMGPETEVVYESKPKTGKCQVCGKGTFGRYCKDHTPKK